MLKIILAFILEWTGFMSLLLLLYSLDRVTILFSQVYCRRKHVVAMLPHFSTNPTAVSLLFLVTSKDNQSLNGLSSACFYMFYPARLEEPMLVPKAPRKLSFY